MDGLTGALQDLKVGETPVYLLKTRSSPTDTYEDHFTTAGYRPIFAPVLDHIFRDDAIRTLRRAAERFAFAGGSEATKRQIATNNPAKKYGGIIFTSQRAVDAFAIVVSKLDPDKLDALFDKDMPIYVVGPATARSIKSLDLPCPVIGEDTGSGDALAKHILAWHATLPREVTHLNGRKLPLLFLVGEQRRDIIPTTLQSKELPAAQQIPVVELIVYETGEMASFEEDFSDLVRQAKRARVKEQWAVVFSPQGCEAMLMSLGWLDEKGGLFSELQQEIMSGPMKTGIATIGPTTRDFLRQQFGYTPDVCAEEPTPQGVLDGIAAYRAAQKDN